MTSALPELPAGFVPARIEVARVAVHVLARARSQAVGRIGLVTAPDGIATPAFGPHASVVRLTPTTLVVDRAGDSTVVPLTGATLRRLAEAAGADVDVPLDVGTDTPPLGDHDAPLDLDPDVIALLGGWFALGWAVLDAVGGSEAALAPARTQLWPEHVDVGTNVAVGPGPGDRVNLGASAGDGFHEAPYLYVGPWDDRRPGLGGYWNAPFGAVLGWDALRSAPDPWAEAVAFLVDGVRRCQTVPGVPSAP